MSTKRTSGGSASKAVTRRQILESFGAIAATTACGGSDNDTTDNLGGSSGTAGTGGTNALAGSGGSAGVGTGKGGTSAVGGAGSTNASAGTSGSSVNAGSTNGGSAGTQASSGAAGTGPRAGAGGSGVSGSAGEGGSVGGAGNGGAAGSSAGTANGGAGGSGPDLVAPPFDDVPSCSVSPTDIAGQGPFFIHDKESSMDVSLFRQDIRGRYNEDAEPGVEMQLHLRVLDSTSSDCSGTPVADVDVYIWHTDAQGYYSGFGTRGTSSEQKPDNRYNGTPNQDQLETEERFCRGVQTTNADGVVSFRSIFPGWYNGRDVHIHVVVLKKDSNSIGRMTYSKQNTQNLWLFTTQFYFEPAFTASVHEAYEPYKARTTGSLATAYEGAILADEANNSGLRAKATLSNDVVTAQMQLVLNPA